MRHLSLLHRLTAVLSSALLLQLSLLASGTLCRMHVDQANAGHGMSAAQHSSQHGAHAPVMSMDDDSPAMPMNGCGNAGSSKSCDAPWSPSGCAAMSSCITATSAMTAPSLSLSTAPTHVKQFLASVQMPTGPALAPELPPPRA